MVLFFEITIELANMPKWLKYKLDSPWTCYKKVRNSYFGKLNVKKKGILHIKIEDCGNDSR